MFHGLGACQLLLHSADCFLQRQTAAIKNAESLFQLTAFLYRHTCAGKTYAVQAGNKSRITGADHERRNILGYTCHTADHYVTANLAELVYRRQTADNSTVLNDNVTCKCCNVRHNNIIAHDAVMCNVSIGHHQDVIADTGFVAFTACTVNSAAFTEAAAVTDNSIAFFTYKF